MRRGDEDHQLHLRGGDYSADSGASGIMDEQEAKASRAPLALDREKRYEPFDDGWPQYEEPFVAV